MFAPSRRAVLAAAAGLGGAAAVRAAAQPVVIITADPLPSWAAGPAKSAIMAYVRKVIEPGPDYIPPEARIAVFDHDGTLWCEQPVYFQVVFAFDRIAKMVAEKPSLRASPSLAAIADTGLASLGEIDRNGLIDAIFDVQEGLTPDAYQDLVRAWMAGARHPRFNRPYSSLVYRPQLELLLWLNAAGFRTYISSGGEVHFMRAFSQALYGIPPEQVIGSSQTTRFEAADGKGQVIACCALGAFNDGTDKPGNIELHIGRRPVLAVGNSDGDQAMLEYCAGSPWPSLQVLIHHDDAVREYAYDRQSRIGQLDKALDEATSRGWTTVSMKTDWKMVFAQG